MNNLLITIIVPCYNQAQYLSEALQSVLEQTYENWECIIVNDGSPDDTEIIAKRWLEKDPRFKYISKENGGLSSARNVGLDNANGDFIQFLDSDDILLNNKLELSLKSLDNYELNQKNVVITNFRMFTDNTKQSSNPYCKLNLELFNLKDVLLNWERLFSIPIHCGLFSINLFTNFKFEEGLKAKEDWLLWLNIFKDEPLLKFIDKPLVYYRLNLKGMTRDVKFMNENHIKSIGYIKNVVSEKDYIEYLLFELQNKYKENFKLKNTINNYQNSATFKIVSKLKNNFFSKLYFKLSK